MANESRYRHVERLLMEAAGVHPVERWVDARRLGVHIRVLVTGDGPPALFLHGGPNAAATWAYVAAAAPGVRCFLVDRPGCGLSKPPRTVPDAAGLPDYVVALTADVLDGLGLARAALVGSSFGGYAALQCAIRMQERVASVLLAGCPAFVPGWSAPRFFSWLRTPGLGRLLLAAPVTSGAVRAALRQMGHTHALQAGLISAEMLAWIKAWQKDTPTLRHDARMIVACGTRRSFDPALDLRPQQLRQIQVPCLILSGTADPVGGEDVVRRLATLVPGATVEMKNLAGHLPWLEDPSWFGTRVVRFVHATADHTSVA